MPRTQRGVSGARCRANRVIGYSPPRIRARTLSVALRGLPAPPASGAGTVHERRRVTRDRSLLLRAEDRSNDRFLWCCYRTSAAGAVRIFGAAREIRLERPRPARADRPGKPNARRLEDRDANP